MRERKWKVTVSSKRKSAMKLGKTMLESCTSSAMSTRAPGANLHVAAAAVVAVSVQWCQCRGLRRTVWVGAAAGRPQATDARHGAASGHEVQHMVDETNGGQVGCVRARWWNGERLGRERHRSGRELRCWSMWHGSWAAAREGNQSRLTGWPWRTRVLTTGA